MSGSYGRVNYLWQLQETNMHVLQVISDEGIIYGKRSRLLHKTGRLVTICLPDEPHKIVKTIYLKGNGNITPAILRQVAYGN